MISECKDTMIPENTHYPNYRKNEYFSGKLILEYSSGKLILEYSSGKLILEISLLPYPYPSESQPCYPAPILSDDP